MKLRAIPVLVCAILIACGGDDDNDSAPNEEVLPTDAVATSEAPSSPPTVGEGEEWIVFQGVELGLTFIRPDGSGNHVILGPPGDQVHPDWSPDGSQIAYVEATDTSSEVLITDPQGTNSEPLITEYPAELSGLFWDTPALVACRFTDRVGRL